MTIRLQFQTPNLSELYFLTFLYFKSIFFKVGIGIPHSLSKRSFYLIKGYDSHTFSSDGILFCFAGSLHKVNIGSTHAF